MIVYDRSKLRGRIVEKYGTITKFAEAIGKSKVSVCAKLNNRIGITDKDISLWSPILGIENEQKKEFFYTIDDYKSNL